ncbi:MAG TPA: cation diffusion facilitator family transporter [Bacilli bacterium]|nr:cation diffusion facilitator family transporter [Bacilli bacterium]
MIKWIIKKTIPDYQNVTNKKVREHYGVLAGVLGILANFTLFAVKLVIGLIVNSIGVISDAFNNLSDMASSIVAVLGSKLSNKTPDEEHPYGHGRLEYIASLIVSMIIVIVGFELGKNSFDKIINPEVVVPSIALYIILGLAILLKLWMFSYNRYIAKKIKSKINKATSIDSLNDVFITSGVTIAIIIGQFTTLPVDGIMGMIIAIMIVWSGFSLVKDSASTLIGCAPDPKLVKKIEAIVTSHPMVIATHDIIVHDYGPGHSLASIHAEVSDQLSLIEAHRAVDEMEKKVLTDLGVDLVIHIDPVTISNKGE